MSRRALGLVLLALGATASHWPRGGRWVSVRGGAQDASSSASKKKEHKKLFENAERAQAERQTGKLKSGSKIELGARSGGSHFLGFLWASTTKVLRGIARRPGKQLSRSIPWQHEGRIYAMNIGQMLAKRGLTAIGVIAKNTYPQTLQPRGPWHQGSTGIQESLGTQPGPLRRLLNFTAMNRQHTTDATSASVPAQPC